MYDRIGRAAIRLSIAYLRRRHRRAIRVGAAVAAVGVGIAAYVAARNVPEG